MPLGNLGGVVFEFISWFLRLYIFLKLEEGGIFADIDQSSEEDVHLASFQGGDFILFQQKKAARLFIAKVVESRSHWKEFDPECRLDKVLKSSSHNLISSYVTEAELISNFEKSLLGGFVAGSDWGYCGDRSTSPVQFQQPTVQSEIFDMNLDEKSTLR